MRDIFADERDAVNVCGAWQNRVRGPVIRLKQLIQPKSLFRLIQPAAPASLLTVARDPHYRANHKTEKK
ncbi:MAG: hypothetical protein DMF72_06870 [Acidobacteria bacterium]|nr:MAG: hypothetical protein DMF72_06870 [Acidobacteriota bacterium]